MLSIRPQQPADRVPSPAPQRQQTPQQLLSITKAGNTSSMRQRQRPPSTNITRAVLRAPTQRQAVVVHQALLESRSKS